MMGSWILWSPTITLHLSKKGDPLDKQESIVATLLRLASEGKIDGNKRRSQQMATT